MHLLTLTLAAGDVTGPQIFINGWKLLPAVLVLLIWGRLLTWLDKDAEAAHLPREILNISLLGAGLLGFALFYNLPNFWIATGALLLTNLAGFGTYLILRQQKVGLADLSVQFKEFISSMGKSKKVKEAKAGEVQILLKSGPLGIPEAEDPERPAYDTTQELLTVPLKKGCERIEVRAAEAEAAASYSVDGVSYNLPALPRERAAAAISYLKKVAGLDVEDRRKPQNAMFKVSLDGKRREIEIATAGSTVGESMRLTVDPKKRTSIPLDAIGLTPDQLETVKELVQDRTGIVLVSAPRGHGLTSALYGLIRAHDAFLQHIQTIEHAPKDDLEGITQNRLPAQASAAEEVKQVEWVCSQQPDIILIDEITAPQSAAEIIRFVSDPDARRRVYIGMRAGSGFEAIAQWRKLVGDDSVAVQHLKLALTGRVARRLCSACKVSFTPDPETLRKYNMSPNRVTELFQARTQPIVDPKGRPIPCDFCKDLRYKGRFGIFETLLVDDAIRQAVAAGGSSDQLKIIFRKSKGRYLQEMALMQVEVGETSVEEVVRVLRADAQPSRSR